MRNLIFSIPLIRTIYPIARAFFAMAGVCFVVIIFNLGWEGLLGWRIGVSYAFLCAQGLILIWTYIYMKKQRSRSTGKAFEIKESGHVVYHDITPQMVMEKEKHPLSEGRIRELLRTYNSKKYVGNEWNQFRIKLLRMEKSVNAPIKGNVIEW